MIARAADVDAIAEVPSFAAIGRDGDLAHEPTGVVHVVRIRHDEMAVARLDGTVARTRVAFENHLWVAPGRAIVATARGPQVALRFFGGVHALPFPLLETEVEHMQYAIPRGEHGGMRWLTVRVPRNYALGRPRLATILRYATGNPRTAGLAVITRWRGIHGHHRAVLHVRESAAEYRRVWRIVRDVGASRVDRHKLTTGFPARPFGDGEAVRFCQREDKLAQRSASMR